jgi:hypothetical protein
MARPPFPAPSFLLAVCAALLAFVGSSFAAGAHPGAGTYFGIVHGSSYDQTGYVRAVIGKSGLGSVSVKLGDQATCAVSIGPGGTITGGPISFSPVKLNPPMQVHLSLITLPQGGTALSGTIIDDWGDTFTVTLPNITPTENASALAGRYTLFLETPSAGSAFSNDIAGFGTLRIFKTGHLIFHGTLSDGSGVVQLGALDSSGGWSLYAKQARGSVLSGEVTFADETESDLTGDLVLAGPGKNGGPDVDTSMQLVGSAYNSKLAWNPSLSWQLTTSADDGATVAFSCDLTAHGDTLIGGNVSSINGVTLSSVPAATGGYTAFALSPLPKGVNLAGVYLEQDTGRIIGGYGTGFLTIDGLIGVVFQKTSGAFGLTTSLGSHAPVELLGSIAADASAVRRSLTRAIPSILHAFKAQPSGIFAIGPNSEILGSGGFTGKAPPDTGEVGGGTFDGGVSISSGGTFSLGGASFGTYDGVIAGSGSWPGAGSLSLSNGSPFFSSVTVNGGTLILGGTSGTTGSVLIGNYSGSPTGTVQVLSAGTLSGVGLTGGSPSGAGLTGVGDFGGFIFTGVLNAAGGTINLGATSLGQSETFSSMDAVLNFDLGGNGLNLTSPLTTLPTLPAFGATFHLIPPATGGSFSITGADSVSVGSSVIPSSP